MSVKLLRNVTIDFDIDLQVDGKGNNADDACEDGEYLGSSHVGWS